MKVLVILQGPTYRDERTTGSRRPGRLEPRDHAEPTGLAGEPGTTLSRRSARSSDRRGARPSSEHRR
jgi:hypothetical protein